MSDTNKIKIQSILSDLFNKHRFIFWYDDAVRDDLSQAQRNKANKLAAELADKVRNAGSVFLGPYSPESAGDYASGTNHTLPTNGYAKAYNGVNLDSYMRKVTFQEISREGLRDLGPVIETMATAEQLDAHRNAVTVRLANI